MAYQPYRQKATPTWVKGHNKVNRDIPDIIKYDSYLESRCATLMIRMGIGFTPHVAFQLYDRSDPPKPFTYVVDFLLKKQIKPIGASVPIAAIEIKGRLKFHDFLRADSLRFFKGIRTLIVGDDLLTMWEEQGMFAEREVKK